MPQRIAGFGAQRCAGDPSSLGLLGMGAACGPPSTSNMLKVGLLVALVSNLGNQSVNAACPLTAFLNQQGGSAVGSRLCKGRGWRRKQRHQDVCMCVWQFRHGPHVLALFILWSIKPHGRRLRLSECWTKLISPKQMIYFWLISKKLELLWPCFLYSHQWILNYKPTGLNFQRKIPPVHFVGLI